MRFVLNTKNPDTAAGLVCIKGLGRLLAQSGHSVVCQDWDNYDQYDVVIFMSYDADVASARIANPDLLIGIADPKPKKTDDAEKADFLMVSSVEQREAFSKYNPNIFIYYMFPEFESFPICHEKKSKITLGYHGNRVHLDTFCKHLTPVLDALGEGYDLSLKAVYNVQKLGTWSLGRPDPSRCPVVDLQWYENCYQDYFKDVDIGLVPQFTPLLPQVSLKRFLPFHRRLWLLSELDHVAAFKSSTNSGRLFVFGMFGIPVVTEAAPSSVELVRDGVSGEVVLNAEGWYYALERLIQSHELRAKYGAALHREVSTTYSRERTFERFMTFVESYKPVRRRMLGKCHHSLGAAWGHDLWRKVTRKLKGC